MKKIALFFLFLSSMFLHLSMQAEPSWLQWAKQGVTSSREKVRVDTAIVKEIFKKLTWKDWMNAAGRGVIMSVGMTAFVLIFAGLYAELYVNGTNNIIERWRSLPSHGALQEYSPKYYLEQRAITEETLENLLPKDVVQIVGSYLYKYKYELYKIIPRQYVKQGAFVLNNNGTVGIDWYNAQDRSDLHIWDITQARLSHSFHDTNTDKLARTVFLNAYFKEDKVYVISTQNTHNAVTIKNLDLDQKNDRFDTASGGTIATFQPEGAGVLHNVLYTSISGNGKIIAVVCKNFRVHIGEIPSHIAVDPIAYTRTFQYDSMPIIVLNEEGTQALSLNSNNQRVVSLWDIRAYEPTKRDVWLKGRDEMWVKSLSFNRDGKQMAIAGSILKVGVPELTIAGVPLGLEPKRAIYVLDTDSQKVVAKFSYSPFVVYNHAGNLIATAEKKTVKLWNEDGTLFQTLPAATSPVFDATFSGDDRTLATIDMDNIRIWKTKTDKQGIEAIEGKRE